MDRSLRCSLRHADSLLTGRIIRRSDYFAVLVGEARKGEKFKNHGPP